MIQRYKITTHITPTLSGGYDTVAIAVPDEQGDFVQYEAVAHLIEEKTLEQHRAEFELWMSDNGQYPRAVNKNLSGVTSLPLPNPHGKHGKPLKE